MKRGFSTLLLLVAVLQAAPARAGHVELIAFPGRDFPLRAAIFAPGTPGKHPAVIALHGCAGLYSSEGVLSPRHQDWGDRLAAAGFIVLMPDSYGSRGLGRQCKVHDRQVRPARERLSDAQDALRYLQGRADVNAQAVSLLGWSNGGSTVLQAVRAGAEQAGGSPDFASAVAFYPGCRLAEESQSWSARVRLLILIGGADTWTPAAPCQELVAEAARRGEPVSIKVYPGAVHDFDHPALARHVREGLAYTGDGSGEAEIGTDPVARADALRVVGAFLAR